MKLYPHQEELVLDLEAGKRYIVSGCRTGKTRPAIEFMRRYGNVLVLTKKAAIGGWESELSAMGVESFTVVNYEKLRTKGWDWVKTWGGLILDEIHAGVATYAKPNLVCKAMKNLRVSGPRIGVSATPCPESYSQLFHQARCLELPIWREYKNFYAWFREYGIPSQIKVNNRMIETYRKVKQQAWDEFAEFCSILNRAEVIPDFVEADDCIVRIESDEALSLCREIRKEMILEAFGSVIVADTPMAVAQKCQQICAGVVLDENGEPVVLGAWKADWIRENFEGKRVAILTTFRAEVDLIDPEKKFRDVESFQRGEVDWVVGNVRRLARGVDFSMAESLVITGCPWSAEAFLQSRERLLRRDRTKVAKVYFPVISGGIDEKIYKVVAGEKRDFNARIYV